MERRTELRRGEPLRRTTRLQPGTSELERRTPIKARSEKREQQMSLYRPRAAAFLAAHPRCQFPSLPGQLGTGCYRPATEVHHRKGREGERLLDERYWAASCRDHNEFAERCTGISLVLGWLLPIEDAELHTRRTGATSDDSRGGPD